MNSESTDKVNVQEIVTKGTQIYNAKKADFEPAHNGKYVTIEVNSGECFIGDTREDAVAKAETKFPGKLTFSKKIGIIETLNRHSSNINNSYGRILRYQ